MSSLKKKKNANLYPSGIRKLCEAGTYLGHFVSLAPNTAIAQYLPHITNLVTFVEATVKKIVKTCPPIHSLMSYCLKDFNFSSLSLV